MDHSQLKIGDRIVYKGGFGLGPMTQATIINFDEKNDRPLAILDDGHWCYLRDILSVWGA
jgi:hypothetical protein